MTSRLIKIGVYAGLLLGVYYSALEHLVWHDWWRADYSYCFLIPPIVLYLIWDKRGELFGKASFASWVGSFVLLVGLSFYLLGELGGEYLTLYISLWMVIVGLAWLHLGWRRIKPLAFAFLVLLAAFPLPNFLNNKLTWQLRLVSSQLGVKMMQILGMSAYREGNIIDLGFTQLQVVDACSGLRYFFPLVILALILAYLYKDRFWKRAFLVLSAAPLAVAMNALRIAVTGILYEHWGAEVAEGFFHGFSGWLMFMSAFVILLLEMRVLGFRFYVLGVGKRGIAAGTGTMDAGLDRPSKDLKHKSATEGLKPKTTGFVKSLFQPHFVVAVVLLSATWVVSSFVEFRERVPIAKSFDEFPLELAGWSGYRVFMEQDIIDTLDLTDYFTAEYRNYEGRTVNFYVAYYESQRKGESIHSPATCLPGGGWVFNEAGPSKIQLPGHNPGSMPVNRAFMQMGDFKQLVYYWFPMRGRILTNAYQLKLYTFWDALTRQRTDGSLVRVITPVYENEEVTAAEDRLQGFVRDIRPILKQFLPE